MSSMSEALRLYQDGHYEEAAKRLRILTEFDSGNPQPWLYYGAALGQLGRWGQAADAYRYVVELLPEEVSGYCDLAEALLQAGRLEQAEDAVQMALSLAPDHPVALDLRKRVAVAAPTLPKGLDPSPPAEPRPEPTSPPPPPPRGPNRLSILVAILILLLGVVVYRVARLPGERWRPIREASSLLDAADREREKLHGLPGEDLEQVGRMRELLAAAEVRLYPIRGVGASPEAGYLRGRLFWCRDQDRFAARNELQEALSRLSSLPGRQRRPLGMTAAQLQAAIYRLLARIEIESIGGSLQRADDWATKAKAAAPSRDDAALAAELAEARRARR